MDELDLRIRNELYSSFVRLANGPALVSTVAGRRSVAQSSVVR